MMVPKFSQKGVPDGVVQKSSGCHVVVGRSMHGR